MEIKEMQMSDIEARSLEIEELMKDENADIESLTAEVEQMEERKAEIEKEVEARKMEMAEAMKKATEIEHIEKEEVRKTMDLKELRSSDAYKEAYAKYILSNCKNDKELRSLFTEDIPVDLPQNGSVYPVPSYLETKVQTAWERDEITSRFTKTYFKGNLKIAVEYSATAAVLHLEGTAAPAEENLQLKTLKLVPQTFKKWIRISSELYEMGGSAVLDYIYDELAYQIVKAFATAGLVDGYVSTDIPVIKIQENLSATTIVNAAAQLSAEATDLVAVMNRQTWGALKAIQVGQGANVGDVFDGLKVIFTDALPAYSTAGNGDPYIVVGDLKSVHANFPNGDEVKFIFDEASEAEDDMVKVVGKLYAAVGYAKPNALAYVTKESGGN